MHLTLALLARTRRAQLDARALRATLQRVAKLVLYGGYARGWAKRDATRAA